MLVSCEVDTCILTYGLQKRFYWLFTRNHVRTGHCSLYLW